MTWPFKNNEPKIKTARELLNETLSEMAKEHKQNWQKRYQPPCEYCNVAYDAENGVSIMSVEVSLQHAILHELRGSNNERSKNL